MKAEASDSNVHTTTKLCEIFSFSDCLQLISLAMPELLPTAAFLLVSGIETNRNLKAF